MLELRSALLRVTLFVLTVFPATAAINVGYTNNPPQVFRDSDGRAAGFVPDVLNEAARRAGIVLNWIPVEPGTNPVTADHVDLWPAGVITAERRKVFYITTPWWRNELLVVTRAGVKRIEELAGQRLAYTRDLEAAARDRFPEMRSVASATHSASAVALCEGQVDAMITDRLILDGILLARPTPCMGVNLGILAVPDATLDLAILARPSARDAAERLRKRIDQMEGDGTVASLALRYPAISAGSAGFIAAVIRTEHRIKVLRLALTLATALLIVSAVLLYWLFQDVSKRKKTEAVLRQTNADLEQFSYAASHDLSEPLRNMAVFSEVIERRYSGQLDDDGRRFLRFIQEGAHRMHRLLESLGAYTRLSKDGFPRAEVDSREVWKEACANCLSEIELSGAVVTCDELPRIHFDSGQLLEIFQNLISNALKYRRGQPPVIHAGAKRSGNEWVFSVRDNGIGIAQEHQDKIFAVFKRLHGREVPGTGMGLAICKRIVERAGGRIWVDSQHGSGSTFSFTVMGESSRFRRTTTRR